MDWRRPSAAIGHTFLNWLWFCWWRKWIRVAKKSDRGFVFGVHFPFFRFLPQLSTRPCLVFLLLHFVCSCFAFQLLFLHCTALLVHRMSVSVSFAYPLQKIDDVIPKFCRIHCIHIFEICLNRMTKKLMNAWIYFIGLSRNYWTESFEILEIFQIFDQNVFAHPP